MLILFELDKMLTCDLFAVANLLDSLSCEFVDIALRSTNADTPNVVLRTVRLAGSSLPYQGRLEVFYYGVWGTVCDDGFSDVDARVACYSLGYG